MPSRKERKERRRKQTSVEEDSNSDDNAPEDHSSETRQESSGYINWYQKHYGYLLLLPFAILVGAAGLLIFQTVTTGTFVKQDVSLKGGLSITHLSSATPPASEIETKLQKRFPNGDVRVRNIERFGQQQGVTVDATDIPRSELVGALKEIISGFDDYSVERIGSSLGKSFFQQTMIALVVAFLFMALVVFYYFQSFVPSAAVVLAALSDIVVTVAMMNVLGIRLSTAGIAALLMLIGYSVDTDILLSTRVLHRSEGSAFERMWGAVKTGVTLNLTTLTAITVALIVSESQTISQIMTILLIGLLVDVINTWLQNTGILTWYIQDEG